jgi:CRISPR-associated endonuclease/helicase Cas3
VVDLVAHSPSRTSGQWHGLGAHLRGTAELASHFAAPFGGDDLACVLGAVHDTGKASCAWQDGLRRAAVTGARVGVGHKQAGALLLLELLPELPYAALAVLGHHGGLPDAAEARGVLLRAAIQRQEQAREMRTDAVASGGEGGVDPELAVAIGWVRRELPDLLGRLELPEWVKAAVQLVRQHECRGRDTPSASPQQAHQQHRLELWLRMVFSALVNADFLDTEAHHTGPRRRPATDLATLYQRFSDRRTAALTGRPGSPAGALRETLYQQVIGRAAAPPGLFSLAAPTGAGKTLTVMGFALAHAAKHGQRRVVVATPFITVTEQNAAVYRDLLDPDGAGTVLEHHSAVDDAADNRQRRELVANWDAPIVVTTTVQLLQSLHDRRPSACRKLHRLAGSVIVLDEVQALPHRLLPTILTTLRLLVEDYNCSVVLTTATPPALEKFHQSPFADLPITELVEDPSSLYAALARVRFDWKRYPSLQIPALAAQATALSAETGSGRPKADWAAVAADLWAGVTANALAADSGGSARSALLIASTTADAAAAFRAVADGRPGTGPPALLAHLSTRMTREHRSRVLAAVRARLAGGLPVVLTATQVVEAGVDLDFPFLVRVSAPAEAIVQAAGRCNREGRRAVADSTVLIAAVAGAGTPGPLYRAATALCEEHFAPWTSRLGGPAALEDPAALTGYFADFFDSNRPGAGRRGRDDVAAKLTISRSVLDYPTTAEQFRMIEQVSVSVLVPPAGHWNRDPDAPTAFGALVAALRSGERLSRSQLRVLTDNSASVSQAMATTTQTQPLDPDGRLLLWTGHYDDALGCVASTDTPDVLW